MIICVNLIKAWQKQHRISDVWQRKIRFHWADRKLLRLLYRGHMAAVVPQTNVNWTVRLRVSYADSVSLSWRRHVTWLPCGWSFRRRSFWHGGCYLRWQQPLNSYLVFRLWCFGCDVCVSSIEVSYEILWNVVMKSTHIGRASQSLWST